jgi:putative endonuclease
LAYVYILRSLEHVERYYVGVTADLRARLRKHNAGEVSHTSKYAPWAVKTYTAFSDEQQAFAFENISSHHRAGPSPRSGFDPERVPTKPGVVKTFAVT